jgi:hypothetical protein
MRPQAGGIFDRTGARAHPTAAEPSGVEIQTPRASDGHAPFTPPARQRPSKTCWRAMLRRRTLQRRSRPHPRIAAPRLRLEPTQPRYWGMPRKHIADGPQGAATKAKISPPRKKPQQRSSRHSARRYGPQLTRHHPLIENKNTLALPPPLCHFSNPRRCSTVVVQSIRNR